MPEGCPSWIGGDCPNNLPDLLSFVEERAAWLHKFHTTYPRVLAPDFVEDIAKRVGPPQAASADRAKWASEHVWLWADRILTCVNHWLDHSSMVGPVWQSKPPDLIRADQHFSALIAWCKEKADRSDGVAEQGQGPAGAATPPDLVESAKRWAFSKLWLVIPGVILLVLLPWCVQIVQGLRTLLEWFGVK